MLLSMDLPRRPLPFFVFGFDAALVFFFMLLFSSLRACSLCREASSGLLYLLAFVYSCVMRSNSLLTSTFVTMNSEFADPFWTLRSMMEFSLCSHSFRCVLESPSELSDLRNWEKLLILPSPLAAAPFVESPRDSPELDSMKSCWLFLRNRLLSGVAPTLELPAVLVLSGLCGTRALAAWPSTAAALARWRLFVRLEYEFEKLETLFCCLLASGLSMTSLSVRVLSSWMSAARCLGTCSRTGLVSLSGKYCAP